MDNNFTEKIGTWLNTAPDGRDYSAGALMLLQLSGNRVRYNNMMRRLTSPVAREHIEHQLQKYYNFRVQALTEAQVSQLDSQVAAIIEKEIPLAAKADTGHLGKRADHDSLPEDVQALYLENRDLVRRMRELHLKLRSLSTENSPCPASERYPFLKEIIAIDKKMHSNWEKYDTYAAPVAPAAASAAKPKKRTTRKKSAD